MTTAHEIDDLKRRIEKAQAERDSWHRDGPQERFLDAYLVVKTLELQLDEALRQPIRGSAGKALPRAEPPTFTVLPGRGS